MSYSNVPLHLLVDTPATPNGVLYLILYNLTPMWWLVHPTHTLRTISIIAKKNMADPSSSSSNLPPREDLCGDETVLAVGSLAVAGGGPIIQPGGEFESRLFNWQFTYEGPGPSTGSFATVARVCRTASHWFTCDLRADPFVFPLISPVIADFRLVPDLTMPNAWLPATDGFTTTISASYLLNNPAQSTSGFLIRATYNVVNRWFDLAYAEDPAVPTDARGVFAIRGSLDWTNLANAQ